MVNGNGIGMAMYRMENHHEMSEVRALAQQEFGWN